MSSYRRLEMSRKNAGKPALFLRKLYLLHPWLRGRVTFDVISWDDPDASTPMPAHLTPQEAINKGLRKPSECDIVVVILWSKMGTPLPEEYKKHDNSRYMSGTEYEFLDALTSAKKRGLPNILIYHCKNVPSLPINITPAQRIEAETQWQRVEQFFDSLTNSDGSMCRHSLLLRPLKNFRSLWISTRRRCSHVL